MWWSALARWAERQPWPDLSTAWSVQPWRDWGRHLQTMGVLRHGQGDDDWSLWAAPLTQDGGLSMGALSRLVEAWSSQGPAAGLGWALHRWALGDWVLRQASAWPHDDAVPVYAGAGTWGWCPEALVPWWRGQALCEAQSEALSDWSRVASTGSMLLLPGHWTHLVRAVWRGRAPADASMGGWQWQVLAREQAELHAAEQVGPAALGLRPLQSWCIRAADDAWQALACSAPHANALWREVLLKDQLGVMAVASGAWQAADRVVQDHVTLRRQGGRALSEHPAVQQMRGRMVAAGRAVAALMQAWQQPTHGPEHLDALAAVLLDRCAVHEHLARLTDEGLQAMGAAGYLADSPVAQAWRDQRVLRQLAGGVADAHRVAAGCARMGGLSHGL